MTALALRTVRDGAGNVRHVLDLSPPDAPTRRTRKPRPVPDPIRTNGESAAEELRLLIERAERIKEEVRAAQDDLADVFAEAKSRGYSDKALRTIMAIRQKDRDAHAEEQTILELYQQHLGMM